VRYKIVIFDGGMEEIVIWAASVDVGDLNDTSDFISFCWITDVIHENDQRRNVTRSGDSITRIVASLGIAEGWTYVPKAQHPPS